MKTALAVSAAVMVFALGAVTAHAVPFSACGTLVPGVTCPVLFRADTGETFVVENLGGFPLNARVRVTGDLDRACVTVCLQGDGCIRNNTISAGCAPPPPPAAGFKCYQATGQAPRERIDLSDQFENEIGARVLLPEMLCVPVNGLGQPIDSVEDLTCYRTYPPAKQPRFDRQDVTVNNEFGTQVLDVFNRANLLCVPSSTPAP